VGVKIIRVGVKIIRVGVKIIRVGIKIIRVGIKIIRVGIEIIRVGVEIIRVGVEIIRVGGKMNRERMTCFTGNLPCPGGTVSVRVFGNQGFRLYYNDPRVVQARHLPRFRRAAHHDRQCQNEGLNLRRSLKADEKTCNSQSLNSRCSSDIERLAPPYIDFNRTFLACTLVK